jgi:hypothetical protein
LLLHLVDDNTGRDALAALGRVNEMVGKRGLVVLGAFVSMGLFAGTLRADIYGFENITHTNPVNAAIGEAQLTVEVTSGGSGKVLFTFENSGPSACSITDIYFDSYDGGALASIASIDNSDPGVSFSAGAAPPDLPGGNNAVPPFVATANLSSDSDSPVSDNGVGPGEFLGILFNLGTGATFGDVINELNNGSLRIGLHVQSFPDGGSEAFINDGTVVPAPSAALLGMIGLGMTSWLRGWRK